MPQVAAISSYDAMPLVDAVGEHLARQTPTVTVILVAMYMAYSGFQLVMHFFILQSILGAQRKVTYKTWSISIETSELRPATKR